jgi:NhaP-type Na+/H+ or K+/H+ antiporter
MAMQAGGMDTRAGEIILAVAVLSIVVTAPLGAVAIKWVGERVLAVSPDTEHAALDALCDSR